jgi:hypothetical protein
MKTCIIAVTRQDDGTLVICDASGRHHPVHSGMADDVLREILDDDSIPNPEKVKPERYQFENAASKICEGIAPAPLRPFAGPVAKLLVDRLITLSDKRHSRRRAG